MRNKKQIRVIEVDQSPQGKEELVFILQELLATLNHCKNEEELKAYLRAELAKPKEDFDRETKALVLDARRRFRESRNQ